MVITSELESAIILSLVTGRLLLNSTSASVTCLSSKNCHACINEFMAAVKQAGKARHYILVAIDSSFFPRSDDNFCKTSFNSLS